MSTTLCQQCFPQWEQFEVKTIVPLSPCVECGAMDDRRRKWGAVCHLFPGDPREKVAASPPSPQPA